MLLKFYFIILLLTFLFYCYKNLSVFYSVLREFKPFNTGFHPICFNLAYNFKFNLDNKTNKINVFVQFYYILPKKLDLIKFYCVQKNF